MLGVTCDPTSGNILQLSLGRIGLNGRIPDAIWLLNDLQALDLSSNSLHGPIPERIGNLALIQILNLNSNYLSGSIPQSVGNMKLLETLDVSANALTGAIPDAIGSAVKLKSLVLNKNQLYGGIPNSIGNLNELKFISLSFNSLNGSIPQPLTQLTNLETLDLVENQLSGPLPTGIGNLKSLESILLSSNLLSGILPEEIGQWMSATDLDFSLNQFTGNLPASIGQLSQLQLLNVNYNSLSGNIPHSITKCINLLNLRISLNNFSGPIPDNFGNLVHLQTFHAYQNSLSGPLPPSLGELTSIVSLDLSNNEFVGEVPETFANLVLLNELDLSYNSFTGTFPLAFVSLDSLKHLDLHHNKFSGAITPSISRMRSLENFDIARNNFSGPLPDLSKLLHLKSLVIFDNNFTGVLPVLPESVEIANMGKNDFSGDIPLQYTFLPNLTILQTPNCLLSGKVPTNWLQAGNLLKLDLQNNMVEGPLPTSLPMSLKCLHLASNSFSGEFVNDTFSVNNLPSLISLDVSGNLLSGTVPAFASRSLWFLILSDNMFGDVDPTLLDATSSRVVFSMVEDPWCQSSTNQLLSVCSVDAASYAQYSSPPLCVPSPPCGPNQAPNPNLKFTKNLCQCSEYLFAQLLFTSPTFDYLNAELSGELITLLGAYLVDPTGENVLDVNQIRITKGLKEDEGSQLVELQLFTLDGHPFKPNEEGQIVSSLIARSKYNGEIAASFGPYILRQYGADPDAAAANASASPPPGFAGSPLLTLPSGDKPSPSSSSSSSPPVITIAAAASAAIVVVVLLLLLFCYCARMKKAAEAQKRAPSLSDFQVSVHSHFVPSVPLSAILRATNHFGADHLLGEGGHGSVYWGKAQGGGGGNEEVWAIKRSKIVTKRGLQLLQNEIDSLSKVSHRNLVKLLGFCDESNEQILIYEFVTNGNLQEHLRPKKRKDDKSSTFTGVANEPGSALPAPPPRPNSRSNTARPPLPTGGGKQVAAATATATALIHKSNSEANLAAALAASRRDPTDSSTSAQPTKAVSPSGARTNFSFAGSSPMRRKEPKASFDFGEKRELAPERPYSASASSSPLHPKKGLTPKSHLFSLGFSSKRTDSSDEMSATTTSSSPANATAATEGSLSLPLQVDRPPLSFEHRLRIAIGTAEGLHYLHSFANPGIIHRDVKSENILLTDKLEAKLADFGLLKSLKDEDRSEALSTRVAGTPGYMDPEYYKTFKVTTKSDVYSFGVVLLELITGRPPAMDHNSTTEQTFPAHSKIPTSQEPKQFITISEWAFPLIANGEMEALADPKLGQDYPREALRKMAFVALQCIQRSSADRPDMGDVVLMLKDIEAEVMGKKLTQHHAMPVDGDYAGVPMQNFSSTNCGETVDASAPMSVMLVGR